MDKERMRRIEELFTREERERAAALGAGFDRAAAALIAKLEGFALVSHDYSHAELMAYLTAVMRAAHKRSLELGEEITAGRSGRA